MNYRNPQTWNRYAYVANNPISFVDPLGLYLDGPGQCSIAGDSCFGGGAPGGGGGGFCDASGDCSGTQVCWEGDNGTECGNFGGAIGVGPNGVPWNWGPGYAGRQMFGVAPLLQAEARYLSILNTGIDPAIDPCAYLNNAGNGVESTDTHSNPSECKANGGIWVPENMTLQFNPNGTYSIIPLMQQRTLREKLCFYTGQSFLAPILTGTGLGMGSISWGGTLTTLGLSGVEVGSFAAGAATVGPYLAVGGAILLVARGGC